MLLSEELVAKGFYQNLHITIVVANHFDGTKKLIDFHFFDQLGLSVLLELEWISSRILPKQKTFGGIAIKVSHPRRIVTILK